MSDGTRKVTGVAEITGMEGETVSLQDIFVFDRKGLNPEGKVVGTFRATGVRPQCSDKLAGAGHELAMDMFDHSKEVN
jgi:pilus assembly protein CpaF